MMLRLPLLCALSLVCWFACGQEGGGRSLPYYIKAARENSPLIKDYRNRTKIEQDELERLKAIHTHARLELNGDYLFVPVISKDGGHTAFKWNARSATDYYGYDLGQSSGSFHAEATLTQPLLGGSAYKTAQAQAQLNTAATNHLVALEAHRLERAVTEQYLLCLLDKAQMDFTDSVDVIIGRRIAIVHKLAENGLAKQSDLKLLAIEREANAELHVAARQDFHTHLADLNLLCGIDDTCRVALSGVQLPLRLRNESEPSLFVEQYRLDSLQTAADLRTFCLQYKPRLDLFVNGGLQTGDFARCFRHFGLSAGLTFSWTIFDGRQKRLKESQAGWRQNTIRTYREHAEYQRSMRTRQCLAELKRYDERERALNRQLAEYDAVLADYGREMVAGQASALDYITVLRSKVQTEKDCLLLQTNRQLVIAAYNYWNR